MAIQSVTGCAEVAPIECVSPRKNKWKIRWNITAKDDGTADWLEANFGHKPTAAEIRETIIQYHNEQVDAKILSGYVWNDMAVWLSTENQFNYKAAYDLAVQSGGATLPVTFKFGTDDVPVYHTFSTLDELAEFYKGAMEFINTTLQEGWTAKDSVDFSVFEVE